MPDPRVSICIPAYRRPEELGRAIQSALGQTFQDLEVVVVDDSGDGRLARVVSSFSDERVRYFSNATTLGMGANFKAAVEHSRGNIVSILGDDDHYLPRFLERLLPPFEDPHVGVTFCQMYWDEGDHLTARRTPTSPGTHEQFLAELIRNLPVMSSAGVFRREVWEESESRWPLPNSIMADTVIWLRAALNGWAFHYVAEPLVIYPTTGSEKLSLRADDMHRAGEELWSSMSFDDPDPEILRRQRLAECLLLQASERLQAGDRSAARVALWKARDAALDYGRLRRWVLAGLTRMPWAYGAAHTAWGGVRAALNRIGVGRFRARRTRIRTLY